MSFDAPRPSFGRSRPAAGAAVPAPLMARAARRRTAQLAAARDVLAVLPGPGETLHAVMTGEYDLMHVLAVIVEAVGPCKAIRMATLSYNGRNLAEMVDLLDKRATGALTLLCSVFFRDHNKGIWRQTLEAFRSRGQRAAAARSHVKVITFDTASGRRLSLEGSANLRTNGNREQFALTDDAAVHDWHAALIEETVTRHEGEATEPEA